MTRVLTRIDKNTGWISGNTSWSHKKADACNLTHEKNLRTKQTQLNSLISKFKLLEMRKFKFFPNIIFLLFWEFCTSTSHIHFLFPQDPPSHSCAPTLKNKFKKTTIFVAHILTADIPLKKSESLPTATHATRTTFQHLYYSFKGSFQ